MQGSRLTIAWWMAAIMVLGVNIGVVRAFVTAEARGVNLDLFDLDFLMFFALQVGLWRYLNTTGSRHRFWLGFEIAGIAATLALAVVFEINLEMNNWYTGVATDLSYGCLPARLDAMLTNEHWDWFLVLIYFPPELLAAAIGGLLAVFLSKKVGEGQPVPAVSADSARTAGQALPYKESSGSFVVSSQG
jgi:hypothetical protein